MQIRQNQSFSAQTLRTHRHLFWECWGVVLLGVLLWLLELFAAALLLRIQDTCRHLCSRSRQCCGG